MTAVDAELPGLSELDSIERAAHRWRLRYGGTDALTAALRIQRTQAFLTAELNRVLKPFGLNSVRYEILAFVACSDRPVLVGEIGDWLGVHPTSATNNVERLEATGYVRRQPHPSDRRSTLVELTSRGIEVMDEATASVVEERFGLAHLDPSDLVQLDRILGGRGSRHQ